GVGADLYAEQIPRSQHLDKVSVNNNLDPLRFCLQGGEDYELLFTTPIEDVKKIERLLSTAAAPVTVIGSITGRSGRIRLLKEEQTPQLLNPSQGFDHFSGAG
ncbi:MAG: thiamine-phosphate kinase, partial [Nitrospinales bacterium]